MRLRELIRRLRARLLVPVAAQLTEQRNLIDQLRETTKNQADLVQQLADQVRAGESRYSSLERLLTRGPAALAPGATQALASLGTPAVAVVLPTFNRARFLGEAIASVQRQSFANWELIIVDDGSTDATRAVVEPFLSDRRIAFVSKLNGGPASARNAGIRATVAPLLAYLDDDNVWYPEFLATAASMFAAEPEVDFAYGALVSELHGLEGSHILWRDFDRRALEANNYIDTNVIVHRRTLVERYGEWSEAAEIPTLEDWDLSLRYTAAKPARRIDVLAAYYRRCDSNRITETIPSGHALETIRSRFGKTSG